MLLLTPDTDQFGGSLSVADETLVVGGAGFNSSAGAVYIFTVSRSGVFQADQRLLHPEDVGGALRGDCSTPHEMVLFDVTNNPNDTVKHFSGFSH